ncbi:MAG: leucyl aminopeptidase [Bacteroidota bacterium]
MKFSLNHSIQSYPDLLIVPIAKQEASLRCLESIGKITNVPLEVLKTDFEATHKESQTLYFQENGTNKRIVLLGLGKQPGFKEIISAFRSFGYRRKSSLPASTGVSFIFGNVEENAALWVEAAVNGLELGNYEIGLYKTDTDEKATPATDLAVQVFVAQNEKEAAQIAIDRGIKIAATQMEIFDLVNAPSNKKTPQTLADWAMRSGKKHDYAVQVLNQKEIEELGLHGLLAVNRGSENPPTFIIMEYRPSSPAKKKIGLVGKGVTFDTGGLSIKPSANMHYMKSDMGGAAAVMGTLEMAAKLQLPFHIMGVVPATDNSVDAKSVKPGDVIGSYDGKTIEVIDTDAEGRLILADGLAYTVRHFNPDILIDLATLTGSCIRTLGTYAGGLFSNNDELANDLLASGQSTGERLWQLPIWEEYRNEMKSDVADIKNFSGAPSAGAITAAKFLEAFIQDHPVWAHMDIAGVAVSDSEFSSQKSATAFGVRLMTQYLQQLAEKKA